METSIPLPGSFRSFEATADERAIYVRRTEGGPNAGIAAVLLIVLSLAAITGCVYLVATVIGAPSPVWYLIHPLLAVLALFVLWTILSAFLEHLLFVSSTIVCTPERDIQISKLFAGGWGYTVVLRPPVELHVVLDWVEKGSRVDINVGFYLQRMNANARGLRRYVSRWIRIVPDVGIVRGARWSRGSAACAESEQMAIAQAAPFAEYVANRLGIAVVYARAGGGVIRRYEPAAAT